MQLLVAADDRTGALETAGAIADATGVAVPVATRPEQLDALRDSTAVVDLASRHLTPDRAAERATSVDRLVPAAGRRDAHKIDSALRGNWATEVAARVRAVGSAALVVAALPSLGRTCRGGVVRDDGTPVHEGPAAADVGRRLRSSRPAALLAAAGVEAVAEVAPGATLDAWCRAPVGVAVCDAATDADLAAIAVAWAGAAPTLLAGTSAAIAAGARAVVTEVAGGPRRPPEVRGPVMVVCGSYHPAAREQIARAARRGALVTERLDEGALSELSTGRPVVLVSPTPTGRPDPASAADVAAALAAAAGTASPATLVVLGGDTASAVLGDGVLTVGGTLAPGTPWSHRPGDDVLIVTRSGGFGGPDALVDLLSTTLAS